MKTGDDGSMVWAGDFIASAVRVIRLDAIKSIA